MLLERRTQSMPMIQERRSGQDRRASQRYAANGTSAFLTWPKGDGFGMIEVSLRDISQGGMSAFSESAPPADLPLWFRLCSDDTSAWIGLTIVGVYRTGLLGTGPRLIRARFHQPCPYDLFKTVIGGLGPDQLDPEFARGGLKGRDGFS